MLNRRMIIVIGAVVGAALAAVATWSYLQGADRRAYADAALVRVFRVTKAIPKGTAGAEALDKGFITPDSIPQRFRPATALPDANALRGKIALTPLPVGQVVVEGQFVDPKVASSSFAQRIPTGQVAISVQVDQVKGVAELVEPGDKVNILTVSPDGEHMLLQNVDVIAVGKTPAPLPGEAPPAKDPAAAAAGKGLITFAVPATAAARIAYATTGPITKDTGVYLTLVPPDNQAAPIPVITAGNLYQGSLTPNGP